MNNQATKDYSDLPQFKNIYLEDSFVLGISLDPKCIEFSLEVVLTENHSLYKEPLENESYCYRNAKLTFADFDSTEWLEESSDFSTDAAGETDYGNIDFFNVSERVFDLGGDWGHLVVKGGGVEIKF